MLEPCCARLPDPRARSRLRSTASRSRSAAGTRVAPDAAPAPRERGRLGRAARLRDVGRAAAERGRGLASERGLTAPARLLGADVPDQAAAGLRAARRAGPVRPRALRAADARRRARRSRRARSRLLREALALWRGPALADSQLETFAQDEARRLEELRLVATEDWIDAELELERHHEVVADLESLVRVEPAARAPARAADARALPVGPTGRGARRHYHEGRRAARRRAGDRAGPRAAAALRADPPPGAGAREPTGGGRRRDGRLRGDLAGDRRRSARSGARHRRHARRRIGVAYRRASSSPTYLARPSTARAITPATSRRSRSTSSSRAASARCTTSCTRSSTREFEPQPVHRWLAELPPLLRAANAPQQLIVTTHYDCALEQAFDEAGEPYDVVVVHLARPRPRQVPAPHRRGRRRACDPAAERLCGRAARRATGDPEDPRRGRPRAGARRSRASSSARTTTSPTSPRPASAACCR